MTEPYERRIFFHATSLANARSILTDAFRQFFVDEENGQRYPQGGVLGNGLYVTPDWRTALFFGDTLLSVELRPGTKLLDVSAPVDHARIDSLKREFGHEIVRLPPWKVIPANKVLTGPELVALVRYHYGDKARYYRPRDPRDPPDFKAIGHLKPLLMRHGFHGFGHPRNHDGIVIFSDDRLIHPELVAQLPPRYDHISLIRSNFASFPTLDDLRRCFQREGAPEAKALAAASGTRTPVTTSR